jgi:hypothetical protein
MRAASLFQALRIYFVQLRNVSAPYGRDRSGDGWLRAGRRSRGAPVIGRAPAAGPMRAFVGSPVPGCSRRGGPGSSHLRGGSSEMRIGVGHSMNLRKQNEK